MATNNFKPFATGTGANVTAQADYEALAALLTGFASGKASSAQVNKALRQSTFVAAALAQFIQNKSAIDVLDDGDLAGFVTDLGNALNKHSQPLDAGLTSLAALAGGANLLPYYTAADVFAQTSLTAIGRSLIGQSTQASALSYLGGAPLASPTFTGTPAAPTAATGTNTTQVATTAFVTAALTTLLPKRSFSAQDYIRIPDVPGGLIIQWGSVLSNASGYAPWTYPLAFPNTCVQLYASEFVGASASNFTVTTIGNPSLTSVTAACFVNGVQSSTAGQVGVRYLVIGY